MSEGNEQKEIYSVSISDWISILQSETSTQTNLFLFITSAFIGMIIVIPQIVRDSMGSNLYASIVLVGLLISLFVIFRLISDKSKKAKEPYEKLYNKIILGEITDPVKIRDEYKKIQELEKK